MSKEGKKIMVTGIVIVNKKVRTTLTINEARELYKQLQELFDTTITAVPYPTPVPCPIYIMDNHPRWWVGNKSYSTTDVPTVYCRSD